MLMLLLFVPKTVLVGWLLAGSMNLDLSLAIDALENILGNWIKYDSIAIAIERLSMLSHATNRLNSNVHYCDSMKDSYFRCRLRTVRMQLTMKSFHFQDSKVHYNYLHDSVDIVVSALIVNHFQCTYYDKSHHFLFDNFHRRLAY